MFQKQKMYSSMNNFKIKKKKTIDIFEQSFLPQFLRDKKKWNKILFKLKLTYPHIKK